MGGHTHASATHMVLQPTLGTVLLLAVTIVVLADPTPPPPPHVLQVNGAATKLDALGPVVVGKDGSIGLVGGWANLTPQEKDAGLRSVKRRNAKRLAKLAEEEATRAEAEKRRWPVGRLAYRAVQWGTGVARRFRRRRPVPMPAPLPVPLSKSAGQAAPRTCAAETEAAVPAEAGARATPDSREPALVELDFAPQYVALILSGQKRATTRWLPAEPHLGVVQQGSRLRATCARCTDGEASTGFARLRVSLVQAMRFDALDDELVRDLEGFDDGAEGLRRALRGVYPGLADGDEVSVIHFDLAPPSSDLSTN